MPFWRRKGGEGLTLDTLRRNVVTGDEREDFLKLRGRSGCLEEKWCRR